MNRCRWDREQETYLRDGEPCRTDDYGDPTRHCTAKRHCANHIGAGELTCARCIGDVRNDLRAIVLRYVDLLPEAIERGVVDSEAAMLAGPGTPDLTAWTDRQRAMKSYLDAMARLGRITEKQLIRGRENMDDEDEQHPYTVLCRWQMMLSEDYGHELPGVMTLDRASAYLERTLPRMAQDPEQDFPLFAREIRKCRSHLEAVLRDSQAPERGAPCPTCEPKRCAKHQTTPDTNCRDCKGSPRLVREYPHWCEDPDCEREHWADDREDCWVCPRDRAHAWFEDDYRKWVADVYEANRSA